MKCWTEYANEMTDESKPTGKATSPEHVLAGLVAGSHDCLIANMEAKFY
jgi:hypothetical protein